MKKDDLLIAIGGIDPAYIKAADVEIKHPKIIKWNYFLAGAIPIILVAFLILPITKASKNAIPAERDIKVNNKTSYEFFEIQREEANDANPEYFSILEKIVLPKGLSKTNTYLICSGNDCDSQNNYQIVYSNADDSKNVMVSLSDTNEIIDSYSLESNSDVYTIIADHKVKIFKYENKYISLFNLNGINVKIETNGLTEEEFVAVLESIIQEG